MIFKNSFNFQPDEVYLVRKIDGKAFEISEEYFPIVDGNNTMIFNSSINKRLNRFNYYDNDWDYLNILFDGNNNLYYTASKCISSGECPQVLHRLSITPQGGIDLKPISAENETVWGFCIDSEGNTLYGRAGGEWMRYVRADGKIGEPIPTIIKTNSDAPVSRCDFVWNGTEGMMALYTFMGESDENGFSVFYQEDKHFLMKLNNGQFEKAKEIFLPFTNNLPSSSNVFNVGGKVIYSHFHGGKATLVDISNVNSYQEIACALEANLVMDDQLYHFDKDNLSLTQINIENGATTPVFDLDESALKGYVIRYIMNITETDILFGAHQISDNTNVIAKINVDNELTILQSNSGEVSVISTLN